MAHQHELLPGFRGVDVEEFRQHPRLHLGDGLAHGWPRHAAAGVPAPPALVVLERAEAVALPAAHVDLIQRVGDSHLEVEFLRDGLRCLLGALARARHYGRNVLQREVPGEFGSLGATRKRQVNTIQPPNQHRSQAVMRRMADQVKDRPPCHRVLLMHVRR